jgi:hypothetical protein
MDGFYRLDVSRAFGYVLMSLKRRSLRIGSRRRQHKRLPWLRRPCDAGSGADLDRRRQRRNLLTDYR